MKDSIRSYPIARLTIRGSRRAAEGHPWIYDNELDSPPACPDGSLVDAVSAKGRYIGTGYYNSRSKLRLRLISRNTNDVFDQAFYRRRLQYAYDYRKAVLSPQDLRCCRLIFGEADQFPGLTVDRFENLLSVQILSLGIEQNRDLILPQLIALLEQEGQPVEGVYLRNDVAIRGLEGMREETGWYWYTGSIPPKPETQIQENGIRYQVDVAHGQKTGFFLDQKFNRQAAARIAGGKRVLDCCTHTGSFALNAAMAGAQRVTALDVSASSLATARENAILNGLENRVRFEERDVFDYLREKIQRHEKEFDYIVLDPPAFTKSRKTLSQAYRGYQELNTLAMRLLPRGGYLATCSCSHFMTAELFSEMLQKAAREAGVTLRQIEYRQQACDHPILPSVPETSYLKFWLLQIL